MVSFDHRYLRSIADIGWDANLVEYPFKEYSLTAYAGWWTSLVGIRVAYER